MQFSIRRDETEPTEGFQKKKKKKSGSSVNRHGEIPAIEIARRTRKRTRGEGREGGNSSHPDTFPCPPSPVVARQSSLLFFYFLFFTALLIIDHLITIHYIPSPPPPPPVAPPYASAYWGGGGLFLHRDGEGRKRRNRQREREREKERGRETDTGWAASERGKLFLSAAPGRRTAICI